MLPGQSFTVRKSCWHLNICIRRALSIESKVDFVFANLDSLKPENILIDANGYIKLTDFGMSKEGISRLKRTKSICGTLEYVAPEVLTQVGYDFTADCWALGAVLYEMVTGLPPFYTQDRAELLQRLKYDEPRAPKHVSPKLQSLLNGLLSRDPEKRLSIEAVKKHEWFAGVKWDRLLAQEIKPVFTPKLKGESDVSNFSNVKSSLFRTNRIRNLHVPRSPNHSKLRAP